MGQFEGLAKLATKEIKFKQGALFNNDFHYLLYGLDSSGVNKTSLGICTPLAMAYLRDHLGGASTNPFAPQFHRGKGKKSLEDENNLRIGVANALSQYDYVVGSAFDKVLFGKTGSQANVAGWSAMAKNYSLKFHAAEGELLPDGLYSAKSKTFKKNGGYFIYEDIKSGGAHACALIVYDFEIRFFDPNIGGYKMSVLNAGNFFAEYVKAYGIQYLNRKPWEFSQFISYPVTYAGNVDVPQVQVPTQAQGQAKDLIEF